MNNYEPIDRLKLPWLDIGVHPRVVVKNATGTRMLIHVRSHTVRQGVNCPSSAALVDLDAKTCDVIERGGKITVARLMKHDAKLAEFFGQPIVISRVTLRLQ